MEKMTFREAQLLVIGSERGRDVKFVELNNLQRFNIGDNLTVVEISLTVPAILVRLGGDDGFESYIEIKNLSDWVVDECIGILREVAWQTDENNKED